MESLLGGQPGVNLGLILSNDVVDTGCFQLCQELGQNLIGIHIAIGKRLKVLVVNVADSGNLRADLFAGGHEAEQRGIPCGIDEFLHENLIGLGGITVKAIEQELVAESAAGIQSGIGHGVDVQTGMEV